MPGQHSISPQFINSEFSRDILSLNFIDIITFITDIPSCIESSYSRRRRNKLAYVSICARNLPCEHKAETKVTKRNTLNLNEVIICLEVSACFTGRLKQVVTRIFLTDLANDSISSSVI